MAPPARGEPVRYRVLGARGEGPFAPLVAEEHRGAVRRRVVLRRGAGPQDLGLIGSTRLLVGEGLVATDEGRYAVEPWVRGADLGALRDVLDGPLPPRVGVGIVREVARALRAAGRPHGALEDEAIHLEPDGRVAVGAFRTEPGASAVAELGVLLEALLEEDDSGATDELVAVLRRERLGLPEAEAALEALEGRFAGPSLEDWSAARVPMEPPLRDHPLRGRELTATEGAEALPPKVRIAAVASVTLLLGLATGWALGGTGSPDPEVVAFELPEATALELTCEDGSVLATGSLLLSPTGRGSCRLGVIGPEGEADAMLDVARSGRYLCRAQEGELTCTGP